MGWVALLGEGDEGAVEGIVLVSKATTLQDKSPRGPWLLEHNPSNNVPTRYTWSQVSPKRLIGLEKANKYVLLVTKILSIILVQVPMHFTTDIKFGKLGLLRT